jgi:methyltransferase (TIGR00027 family)
VRLGSREPDASVRNPDWVADRLIGPAELALIADHPISKSLERDFQEAIYDPDVFGFAWLMLVRTRFIDELMERAVRSGAKQLVILGAGFDTRAHRFTDLLKDAAVIEIDYGATQEYKKRRVEEALGDAPANVVYAPIDFARESLSQVLRRAGFQPERKTYYICEGDGTFFHHAAADVPLLSKSGRRRGRPRRPPTPPAVRFRSGRFMKPTRNAAV